MTKVGNKFQRKLGFKLPWQIFGLLGKQLDFETNCYTAGHVSSDTRRSFVDLKSVELGEAYIPL